MNAPPIALKKIWYMMLSNFWARILFMYGLAIELVNLAIGAGSYFFLTKVFQGTTGSWEGTERTWCPT